MGWARVVSAFAKDLPSLSPAARAARLHPHTLMSRLRARQVHRGLSACAQVEK